MKKLRLFLMKLLSGSDITFVSNVEITGDIRLLGFDCYLMNNTFRGKIFTRDDTELELKDGKFIKVVEE